VVYAVDCGWASLSGSLSVSSIVQYEGIWRVGSVGGEVYCCGCSWGYILFGLLLVVVSLGVFVGRFGGVGVVG
jgi:hypothetical protein